MSAYKPKKDEQTVKVSLNQYDERHARDQKNTESLLRLRIFFKKNRVSVPEKTT